MKRSSVVLAAFVAAALVWIGLNALSSESPGSKGLQEGDKLPPFAMPRSISDCRGPCDANIATKPGQGSAGARPACEVRGGDILNSCELVAGGPFVLAFVFEPVAACRDQVRVLERVARKHRNVSVDIIAVRAGVKQARALGSTLPVGYDHDGAVANEYGVVVCPTITYVRRGGHVVGSTVGPQSDGEVEEWMEKLQD
jgi:hypothetical protein